MSVTDNSSLECFPLTSKYQLKKQHRTMKKHALMNKDSLGCPQFNPCHYIYSKDMPPSIEPERFAAILTEKLLHVKKKLEAEEKMEESLRKVEAEESLSRPYDASLSSSFERFARIPPQLITAAMKEKLSRTDESDQSILDEHVSRVWKDSNHTSPDHSPPRPRGLDWGIEPSQEVLINPYQVLRSPHVSRHHISGRHRRERDNCSSDSGTVPDFTPENERTNPAIRPIHVYRHVHHHYLSPLDNPTAPLFKGNNVGPEPAGNEERRRSKETTRRSKKAPPGDSSSSCVDSGVSMVGGTLPPMDVTERVYNWIRDKEKYRSQSHGPDVERESSSKHKKSSRSGTSLVPSASSKQSQSKKPLAYNTSRSGSLERGGSSPWPLPLSGGHIPHPRSSAKDVPLLDPPIQHSESKRRPEDDSRSKSAKPNGRKPGKKSLSTVTAGGDVTIIGYCFAGESVPYRTRLPGKKITLKQFKSLLSKKGNYRYFFKRECNEFGTGVINEEISDENEVLPLWEGKIFALVQPID
ncbi:axin-1-like [Limulus polyphemus]|uniref:Axin-1-like n=1 Tax=Limulus polyphemus TaxID=6850 RepID=A0ABM1TH71_LIMPO|nr:axin-1-like [Limulus polyphemus]